ncbi:5848_t:CDS:2, partial [Dentiscutata erythropus]
FGLVTIPLLIIFGILAFASVALGFVFSILVWVLAFILIFVEIPLCTKICPTSDRFDSFVKNFENHWIPIAGGLRQDHAASSFTGGESV